LLTENCWQLYLNWSYFAWRLFCTLKLLTKFTSIMILQTCHVLINNINVRCFTDLCSCEYSLIWIGRVVISYDWRITWLTDIYFALAVASNNVNSTNPKFTTTSQSFRAVVGDTTTLPCQVEHLGKFQSKYSHNQFNWNHHL